MALKIEDFETEHLAWKLAQLTGETVAIATKRALEERLSRVNNPDGKTARIDDMAAIRRRWSELPVVADQTADELLPTTMMDCHSDPDATRLPHHMA
ncbi:type II toxin-antitoxin system VapB family antitoxin [Bradyrhizobium yuanmingense]|uniref:type II toxin-antitoxin system VapB family antitoxin n=1 Tax=Bradyrhizobium yuanmingense TaxID=108015 RepID=UPI0031BBA8AC